MGQFVGDKKNVKDSYRTHPWYLCEEGAEIGSMYDVFDGLRMRYGGDNNWNIWIVTTPIL